MFEETFLGTWFGIVVVFALGGAAGYIVARQIKSQHTRRLEEELAQTKLDHSVYRSQVERHFQKSSVLFGKLTDNYREVYEHLASGARTFCKDRTIALSPMNLPRSKILPEPQGETSQTPRGKTTQAMYPLVEDELERETTDILRPQEPAQEAMNLPEPSEETGPAAEEYEEYEEDETPLWDAEIPPRTDVTLEAAEAPEPEITPEAEAAPEDEAALEADEVYLGVESASSIDFEQHTDRNKPRPPYR